MNIGKRQRRRISTCSYSMTDLRSTRSVATFGWLATAMSRSNTVTNAARYATSRYIALTTAQYRAASACYSNQYPISTRLVLSQHRSTSIIPILQFAKNRTQKVVRLSRRTSDAVITEHAAAGEPAQPEFRSGVGFSPKKFKHKFSL